MRRLARLPSLLLFAALWGSCAVIEPVEIDPKNPGFVMPETPVVVFFVDGLHKETFETMAAQGRLPWLKKYILDRGASIENAVTCAPSATFSNAAAMVTGMFPSHHGVVGNCWFDRDRLIIRNYESARTMADVNEDIRVPTIYEMLDDQLTAVIGGQAHRGVRLQLATSARTGGIPVGIAWFFGDMEQVDDILARNLYELAVQCRKVGRWPQFVLVHFPGPDEIAHEHGHESEAYRSSLEALDESLGGVLRRFDGGGILDRMVLVLTTDHGHHRVDEGDHFQVVDFFTQNLGLGVVCGKKEVRDDASYVARKELFDHVRVVLTENGGRQCHLHLRVREEWAVRPTAEETLTFHRRFGVTDRDPGLMDLTLAEVLLREPAIEFVAVRDGTDRVLLYGKSGSVDRPSWSSAAVERERPPRGPTRYRYRLIEGDPLDYLRSTTTESMCHGGAYASLDWLEATARLERPDVIPQLVDVFDSPHSGDLVFFAAPHWSFSDEHQGAHGGLLREEMVTPLYFAGGPIKAGTMIPFGRLVDLTPTVLDLMGFGQRLGRQGPMDGVSRAAALKGEAPRDEADHVVVPRNSHPAPLPESVPSPEGGAGGGTGAASRSASRPASRPEHPPHSRPDER